MSLRSSDSKGEAPLQWRFPLTIQKPRKQSQALQTVVREPCGQVLGIESPWQASWYMPSAPRMPVKHQYQSIRSPVKDSEYTNPRPKTQERERGDWRMAREDDRRRRYRKNFKTQRGRFCLRKAISHRMETPIRNLDHSSHRHRGLRKSSSMPVHQQKLTCLSCRCSGARRVLQG